MPMGPRRYTPRECERLQGIEDYDWAFHQQTLDLFVKSPFLLAHRALPGMKARRHGRIINVTSEVFHLGVAPFSAYVAARGADKMVAEHVPRAGPARYHGEHDRAGLDPGGTARGRPAG